MFSFPIFNQNEPDEDRTIAAIVKGEIDRFVSARAGEVISKRLTPVCQAAAKT